MSAPASQSPPPALPAASAPGSDAARFAPVVAVLRDAIGAGATPGAQLAVRYRGAGDAAWRAFDHAEGALSYSADAPRVALDTLYDLASVTKAMVALAGVRAASRGVGALELDAPLARYVAESAGRDTGAATLRALASHRAELPAWQPYYQAVTPAQAEAGGTRAQVLRAVASTAREPSGGAVRYSDVGYILLGEAFARATGRALPELVREQLCAPLGLGDALHFRGVTADFRDPRVAPTERCPWRGRLVQGTVHDENAHALEGVSGHAGLFGTARAVAAVGAASLDALEGSAAWFAPDAMRAMIAPQPGGAHRLGWDGKEPAGSSAGRLMGPRTFGHLGFTGTSVWIDPDARVVVALLTNRVHPTRDNAAIRPLRVAVHDAVMAAIAARD